MLSCSAVPRHGTQPRGPRSSAHSPKGPLSNQMPSPKALPAASPAHPWGTRGTLCCPSCPRPTVSPHTHLLSATPLRHGRQGSGPFGNFLSAPAQERQEAEARGSDRREAAHPCPRETQHPRVLGKPGTWLGPANALWDIHVPAPKSLGPFPCPSEGVTPGFPPPGGRPCKPLLGGTRGHYPSLQSPCSHTSRSAVQYPQGWSSLSCGGQGCASPTQG